MVAISNNGMFSSFFAWALSESPDEDVLLEPVEGASRYDNASGIVVEHQGRRGSMKGRGIAARMSVVDRDVSTCDDVSGSMVEQHQKARSSIMRRGHAKDAGGIAVEMNVDECGINYIVKVEGSGQRVFHHDGNDPFAQQPDMDRTEGRSPLLVSVPVSPDAGEVGGTTSS
eukprot:TRINITY_DN26675_c0_g1_i1.p1 TRINITY_DN26675_c0_g1~~TRINITY_DN26675_c0_g1_i1.p1  ORF type:complete len:193 (-),score=38.60 TRINITY_DN26675_c0_g1_i1:184-696(-)